VAPVDQPYLEPSMPIGITKTTRASTTATLALVALLSACSTNMPTPPSGYLSANTVLVTDAETGNAFLPAKQPIDVRRIAISAVQWQSSGKPTVDEAEQALHTTSLAQRLRTNIDGLSTSASGRPVTVRAALTSVSTVSPALNAVTTVL
jgi:PBP1b-binding outer membrane lipoprotein LpoB